MFPAGAEPAAPPSQFLVLSNRGIGLEGIEVVPSVASSRVYPVFHRFLGGCCHHLAQHSAAPKRRDEAAQDRGVDLRHDRTNGVRHQDDGLEMQPQL